MWSATKSGTERDPATNPTGSGTKYWVAYDVTVIYGWWLIVGSRNKLIFISNSRGVGGSFAPSKGNLNYYALHNNALLKEFVFRMVSGIMPS